jgi:iron complex outermembrane receptor protein
MLSRSLLLAFSGTAALMSAPTFAQSTAPQELERITVTGSNIRRTDTETPSPVQVITADDLKKSGYTTVNEVLQNITANGQGTLSQNFSRAFAGGAAGIALRGLNVGATLVLIDGKRAAPYPIGDDGQRSFVDVSNIPFDAVERVEVVKDGASAIYGSDAVAGVINIILKKTFVGAKITADAGTSYKNDGQTYHLAGTWGFGDLAKDGRNFYISAELRKQNQIKLADRPDYSQTDYSALGGLNLTPGFPSAAANGNLAASRTGYLVVNGQRVFLPGCDETRYLAGQCAWNDTWSQVQTASENRNLVARYTQSLAQDWELSLQGSFFQSKAQQVTAAYSTASRQGITSGPGVVPVLLPTTPRASLPSTNPAFPAGLGVTSAPLRYNFLDSLGPRVTDTDARSSRFFADLTGRLGSWDVNGTIGYSQVLLGIRGTNYVNPGNLQTALNSTTDPFVPGGQNSASVLAFVAPELSTNDTSKLTLAHVGASRELMSLSGGPLSIALGADYMRRTQDATAPEPVAQGLVPSFSNNFTIGKQTVGSVYAELAAPLLKQLEVDAAVRYDHYNLSGGKASPKVGFKYTPVEEFAVRGTVARGFRAPGPAENGTAGQTFFAGTSNDPALCADGSPTTVGNFPTQCAVSVGTIQSTNKDLKPETSTSFTLGFIVEPVKDFSATLDFYQIEMKNQIVAGSSSTFTRGSDFTPIPQVQPDGSTALVTPPVAPIAYYSVTYVNANSTKTNGVDLALRYRHRFEGVGELRSEFMVSHMNKYDVTIDGVTYKLAGTHGPSIVSGDTGNPKTKIQWSNTFERGPWQLTGTINYISSFDVTDPAGLAMGASSEAMDTCEGALANQGGVASTALIPPENVSCKVASFTTFDLSGRWNVSKQFSLFASVRNVFNRKAPLDWATYANPGGLAPYNPSLHSAGAIGRYFTLGASYTF